MLHGKPRGAGAYAWRMALQACARAAYVIRARERLTVAAAKSRAGGGSESALQAER